MSSFSLQKIAKIMISVLFALIIASCSNYQYDGDILAEIQGDKTSTISFKKDQESPVAFTITFEIGKDYKVSDLPGKENKSVKEMNPGFDLGGWVPETSDKDFMSAVSLDENGFVESFHMTPINVTFYGAGYSAATDTPYKIIFMVQNETRDGYDLYDELEMTGTTSTPDAPSFTVAEENLIEIEGFRVRLDLLEEKEILADGSTVVEVYYDRLPDVSITISIPATNEITITSSSAGGIVTLTAVLPAGESAADYSFCWFYTEQGMTSPLSTTATCTINTTTLTKGVYQISLIAVRNLDSMPFGGTVQIEVGD